MGEYGQVITCKDLPVTAGVFCIGCFMMFSGFSAKTEEAPAKAESKETIVLEKKTSGKFDLEKAKALIKDLANDNYEVRIVAHKALAAMDADLYPLLKETAGTSEDLEVAVRSATLAAGHQFIWESRKWTKKTMPKNMLFGMVDLKSSKEEGEGGAMLSLVYLSASQNDDGKWHDEFLDKTEKADTVVTSLALLAFLGASNTEKRGRYKENVKRGVAWLIAQQNQEGRIWAPKDNWGGELLSHAIAGMALAEAAGMGRVAETKAAAQKALDWTCADGMSKDENDEANQQISGWGFTEGGYTHLLPTMIIVMQLKSGRVSDLNVSPAAFDRATRFLDACEDKKSGKKRYGWMPGEPATPEATLCGCLIGQFLGDPREILADAVQWATQEIFNAPQLSVRRNLLTQYSGILAAYQQGGAVWEFWKEDRKMALLSAQHKSGKLAGSWDPVCLENGESPGLGRIGVTAMAGLYFEILDCLYMCLPGGKELEK